MEQDKQQEQFFPRGGRITCLCFPKRAATCMECVKVFTIADVCFLFFLASHFHSTVTLIFRVAMVCFTLPAVILQITSNLLQLLYCQTAKHTKIEMKKNNTKNRYLHTLIT